MAVFAPVHRVLATGAAVAALLIAPAPSTAQEAFLNDALVVASDADDRRKANLASRQVMLVEHMAVAACFLHLGVKSDFWQPQLERFLALFRATEKALQEGNAILGLPEERNERVLTSLRQVDRLFLPYGEILDDILASGTVSAEQLVALNDLTDTIENQMGAAVRLIDAVYLRKNYSMKLLTALAFAGKERVTSQALINEYCLIAAGVHDKAKRVELRADADLYRARLEALRDGEMLIGLPPAPTPAVAEQIGVALNEWNKMENVVQVAVEGAEISEADLEAVSEKALVLLASINQTVFLLEGLE
ncbi:MAG: type IV pili methyl-accepting chemotaxis transducer N-terminal domain-containing protein [Pseudomonadota bacterium]